MKVCKKGECNNSQASFVGNKCNSKDEYNAFCFPPKNDNMLSKRRFSDTLIQIRTNIEALLENGFLALLSFD